MKCAADSILNRTRDVGSVVEKCKNYYNVNKCLVDTLS